ncbi:lipopolysaccharide biosynthesis protein [Pectobacterium versatile]|uniref:lipopolysaccharide biosynthesis protein n=1 Tax=Pectobacterium versatile TaxID=2488639 RepID=UPI001386A886|nr:oligosaccharide flippase family protein [Pectobacterium versatile]
MEKNNVDRKIASNTVIYILSDITVKAIPFFLLPIVTRFLTVEEYGTVNFYLTVAEICTILVTMGGQSYYRFQYFKNEDNAALILIPAVLSLGVFGFFQISFFIYYIGFGSLGYYLWLPVIGLFQSFCALMICKYQMQQKPLRVTSVNISLALLSFITTVTLLYMGLGFSGRMLSIISTPVIIGAAIAFILFCRQGFVLNTIISEVKACLLFGAKSVLTSVSWWLRSGMDRIIIQYILGSVTLGLYSVALQLSLAVSVVSLALNNSVMPRVFQAVNQQDKKNLLHICTLSTMFILISAGGFYFISPLLFRYLLPPSYHESQLLLLPMLAGIVFHGVFLLICNVVTALGRPGFLSLVALVGALAHMTISLTLANTFGITGVVWSATFSYLLSIVMLVMYLFYSKNFREGKNK